MAVCLLAITVPASAASVITGSAIYRERIALPADAVFEATLDDISRADATAEVVGRTRIESPGNVPIRFTIEYDPARIRETRSYAVRAWILVDGRLKFTTDQVYPVLTRGHGSDVSLMLRMTGGGQPTATLENTYWKLAALGDEPVTAHPNQREPHLVLKPEQQRVSGSGGCNRFFSNYKLDGDKLSFGQVGSTMMACAVGMDTEHSFLKMFPKVNSWRITGQQLELQDADHKTIATFEAVVSP
jgi:putative lipoprotein